MKTLWKYARFFLLLFLCCLSITAAAQDEKVYTFRATILQMSEDGTEMQVRLPDRREADLLVAENCRFFDVIDAARGHARAVTFDVFFERFKRQVIEIDFVEVEVEVEKGKNETYNLVVECRGRMLLFE